MNKIRGLKNQEGATAVEFAVILPLLFLIIFGIIEFSIILYDKAMLTNACREGARAASLFSWPDRISEEEVNDVVRNYSEKYLILFEESEYKDPTITSECEQGKFIAVSLEYNYHFLFLPFATLPLDAQSVVRCE